MPRTRHVSSLLAVALAGVGLSACSTTGSSASNFSGEKKAVAETLTNLANAVTSVEAKKICSEDLAKSITKRLTAEAGSCVEGLEPQLVEIVQPELSVESVSIDGTKATAVVKDIVSGKSKKQTVTLVREGHAWKVSALAS